MISLHLKRLLLLATERSSFISASSPKRTNQINRKWIRFLAKQATQKFVKRPPVVTIMGHVDHGKTTLLDNLRNSQIVKQEFGGITQHIGAFVVPFKQKGSLELVTFLDTPGHAAFAAMRQRGANVTDIVVLVVACEDGVLDQTIESIKFAKNSNVPIIVALNKIDKYANRDELERNVELVRKQLVVHDIVTEADGGDVQLVKISALYGTGVEDLKEAILALAETLDLKADVNCLARGHIIESLVDAHRGKLSTILVEQGQLNKGSYLIAGTKNWAKIRALFDERGQLRQSCGPGLPIQVTGWRADELPAAGDPVMQVDSETEAKKIIHSFEIERVEKKALYDASKAAERAREFHRIYHEKLVQKRESGNRYGRVFFSERGHRLKESTSDDEAQARKINLILKCDVDGSLDAILNLLDTYDRDNKQPVKLDIMHHGVGAITDNDYVLAKSFPNSVIYGFNVKLANQKILVEAKKEGISLRLFNVIYHLIDDLKLRIGEKMPELDKDIEIGQANVLQQFLITEAKKKLIPVAGCRCSRGILRRNDVLYKLLRNNQVIAQDLRVKTLKHLKDDVKEIEKDRECGISFESGAEPDEAEKNPIEFRPGDVLVCYEKSKFKPKLKWDLKGFD